MGQISQTGDKGPEEQCFSGQRNVLEWAAGPEMTDTHIVVQRAADVGPIDGGHEGEVLPVLALQVVKVLVPGSAVSGGATGTTVGPRMEAGTGYTILLKSTQASPGEGGYGQTQRGSHISRYRPFQSFTQDGAQKPAVPPPTTNTQSPSVGLEQQNRTAAAHKSSIHTEPGRRRGCEKPGQCP